MLVWLHVRVEEFIKVRLLRLTVYYCFASPFVLLFLPYSEDHPVTIATFLAEFSAFMETIILVPEPLIIVGDLNIHVDCSDDCNDASNFLDLLQSFGLTQHVTGPTHEDGHTLDLIITRSFDRVVSTNPVIDTYVSDHASVLCNLDCRKPTEFQEKVSFRKLKSIDMDVFREKVSRSELCTKSFTDLEELVGCYNTTLTNLLDQYAPVKTRTIIKRKDESGRHHGGQSRQFGSKHSRYFC